MKCLAFSLMLVLASACSTSTLPVTRADAERALCADLASANLDRPGDSAMRHLLADADVFERAGDNQTANGLRELVNALRLIDRLRREQTAMAIFLRNDATASQISAIRQSLSRAPGVASVRFESKAEALARFKRLFANQPDLISNVSEDSLPASFRVRLSSPDRFDELAKSIESLAGVDRATVDFADASDHAMGLGQLPALRECLTSPGMGSP